jgi:hypothetical protein
MNKQQVRLFQESEYSQDPVKVLATEQSREEENVEEKKRRNRGTSHKGTTNRAMIMTVRPTLPVGKEQTNTGNSFIRYSTLLIILYIHSISLRMRIRLDNGNRNKNMLDRPQP